MGSYAHPSDLGQPARRRVVLVVEDEVLIRGTIADHLRDGGYAVVEAANATEALDVLASGEAVDIVFSDVQMPGRMDGVSLARFILEHHPGIPVLLTSGNPVPSASFIPKPYLVDDVASRIRRVLEEDRPHNA